MPAKPTKYGIKVWIAADSSNGYVLNFNTNLGREMGQSLTHGLGYHVVTSPLEADLVAQRRGRQDIAKLAVVELINIEEKNTEQCEDSEERDVQPGEACPGGMTYDADDDIDDASDDKEESESDSSDDEFATMENTVTESDDDGYYEDSWHNGDSLSKLSFLWGQCFLLAIPAPCIGTLSSRKPCIKLCHSNGWGIHQ
ncbi:hypothetical protein QZH41_000914 [Actinostola sp. cb2023]|nr:hypothetical protein QZH41_000914 [Actinostola sp. cb2023]